MSATVPQILKEAHRLRKHIRSLQTEIDQGPRVMKAHETQLANEKQLHKDAHDKIAQLKLKIREDESSLRAVNQQLSKFEKQLNDAASSKEYDAKQSEIRQAKEKIAALEESILLNMEELDQRTADLPNVEKRLADAQAEFQQNQKDAQERLERMTADLATAKELLTQQDTLLPADVRTQYDRLIQRHGPDGLAGVQGRSCQGCHTSITEQQKLMIQSGKFVCCANCGRALYIA